MNSVHFQVQCLTAVNFLACSGRPNGLVGWLTSPDQSTRKDCLRSSTAKLKELMLYVCFCIILGAVLNYLKKNEVI